MTIGTKCALILETGTVFSGESLGAQAETRGEVVFNTGMTGYQEVLTDPSYAGQIVCMTYPLIGNYGINAADDQSGQICVKGFIVKEAAAGPNHWQMENRLHEQLARQGIVGIKGIDTRALTRHIREYGALKGLITCDLNAIEQLKDEIRNWDAPARPVPSVSTPQSYRLEALGSAPVSPPAPADSAALADLPNPAYHVVAIDFGIKRNILHAMRQKGFDVTVVPYDTPADAILELNPDGIFLSNGPGDPKDVREGIETIRTLVPQKPVFGICLGHQLLTLALGGDTYKLKFGHRGGNQPVQDLATQKVMITSQNHSYAVDSASLQGLPLMVTHINLNDKTVEGIRHTELPAFSVQYHPEAGPGPNDSLYLFDHFAAMMQKQRTAGCDSGLR